MRKILSKSEEKKRARRNQVTIGIILVAVMLLSTLGYAFQGFDDKKEKIEYKGFEFIESNGYWFTEINGIQHAFKFLPEEVPKINSSINKINNYGYEPLYISTVSQEAYGEIYINMNYFVERFQYACEENKSCLGDYPVKNCTNNFIIIEQANNTEITQKENCVFIKAPLENLTKVTDEFLFKILGIENE